MFSSNVILIAAAFVLALVFIYILYAIIMYQGNKGNKGENSGVPPEKLGYLKEKIGNRR